MYLSAYNVYVPCLGPSVPSVNIWSGGGGDIQDLLGVLERSSSGSVQREPVHKPDSDVRQQVQRQHPSSQTVLCSCSHEGNESSK